MQIALRRTRWLPMGLLPILPMDHPRCQVREILSEQAPASVCAPSKQHLNGLQRRRPPPLHPVERPDPALLRHRLHGLLNLPDEAILGSYVQHGQNEPERHAGCQPDGDE